MIKDALRRLQQKFWFRPGLWTLALGTLAVLVAIMDSHLVPDNPSTRYAWLLLGNVDGARTMLGSIATAMLTVTSLTFSIFMLAIVQTANAYSPRILNEYINDTANQHVLGIMIGTFLYSLITLRDVRSIADRDTIPVLTVNVALLLSLLAIFAFIFFLNHISQSIKVSNIIQLLLSGAQKNLQELFPSTIGKDWPLEKSVSLPSTSGMVVVAEGSGYIQRFDGDKLMDMATQDDLLIRLDCTIGDYIFDGTPLATVWPTTASNEDTSNEDTSNEDQRTKMRQAVSVGTERSVTDDLLFDLRQLSDMAIRALSPGINDPTTAVSCVDAQTTLLIQLLPHLSISAYRCDEDGALRIIAPVLTFEEIVRQGFDQIREYGTNDVATTVRLLHACGEIAKFAPCAQHQLVLWQFVRDVAESAGSKLEGATNRGSINRQIKKTGALFQQNFRPLLLSDSSPDRQPNN